MTTTAKDKLRDFFRAIKRNNTPQGVGALFLLDNESDTVYACALGKGILEYSGISIDEIHNELKRSPAATSRGRIQVIENGRITQKGTGGSSDKLEGKWNAWLHEQFPEYSDSFTEYVVDKNDADGKLAHDIAFEALQKLEAGDWDEPDYDNDGDDY